MLNGCLSNLSDAELVHFVEDRVISSAAEHDKLEEQPKVSEIFKIGFD